MMVKKRGSLSHKLQNVKYDLKSNKRVKTEKPTLNQYQIETVLKKYLTNQGVMTVKSAMTQSLDIDKERARKQLRAFYLRTVDTKGTFLFTVKSSGLYAEEKHQVSIQFNIPPTLLDLGTTKQIFENTPIRFQCGCGRFTYWYRFIATKGGWNLGRDEHRFPKIRNPDLDGVLCKHTIRVFQVLGYAGFQKTFERFVENKRKHKNIKITDKDKSRLALYTLMS